MRTLSADAIVELFKQTSDQAWLTFVEFNHASFINGPLRVVNYTQDLSYNGYTWIGIPFQPKLPSDVKDHIPTISLTVPDSNQQIINELRALDASKRPDAYMDVVRMDKNGNMTLEIGTLEFKMLGYNITPKNIEVTIGYEDDYVNSPCQSKTFHPGLSPAIFS